MLHATNAADLACGPALGGWQIGKGVLIIRINLVVSERTDVSGTLEENCSSPGLARGQIWCEHITGSGRYTIPRRRD